MELFFREVVLLQQVKSHHPYSLFVLRCSPMFHTNITNLR